jgi:hypothetical protein
MPTKRVRDYKRELAQEGPHRVKDRVARNQARRKAIDEGRAKVGDNTVQNHIKPLSKGGSRKGATRKQSRAASNREGGRLRHQ